MPHTHDLLERLLRAEPARDTLVASLYLDLSPEHLDATLEQVVDDCERLVDLNGPPAERQLAERLADFQAELPFVIEAHQAHGYTGLAVFIASDGAIDVQLPLRFPFRTQIVVGHEPMLHQLLVFDEEYERSICISVLSHDLVTACEVRIGDVSRARRLHAHEGQDTVGPRLDAELARLLRDDPRLHVIVLGDLESWRLIEARLGDEVRSAIIERLDDALAPGDPAFLPAVHRCLQRWERRIEAQGVARLLEEHRRGLPTALGLRATLDAIAAGHIDTLFVLQTFRADGWRCDGCDHLETGTTPPACTTCGASVSRVPLDELVVDAAARAGATIETVACSDELAAVGGIGARLPPRDVSRAVAA